MRQTFGRCETLGEAVANVRFGRLHISAWACLDTVAGNAQRAQIRAGGSILLQKFLNKMLGLALIALPEVVITDLPSLIYEILRRPVFIAECVPNPEIAGNGDRKGNLQLVQGIAYVRRVSFE